MEYVAVYVAPGVMTGADQMPLFKGGPALTRHHLPLFLPLAAQEYFGKQYEQLSVTEKQGKWRAKEPLHRGTAFLRVFSRFGTGVVTGTVSWGVISTFRTGGMTDTLSMRMLLQHWVARRR